MQHATEDFCDLAVVASNIMPKVNLLSVEEAGPKRFVLPCDEAVPENRLHALHMGGVTRIFACSHGSKCRDEWVEGEKCVK